MRTGVSASPSPWWTAPGVTGREGGLAQFLLYRTVRGREAGEAGVTFEAGIANRNQSVLLQERMNGR